MAKKFKIENSYIDVENVEGLGEVLDDYLLKSQLDADLLDGKQLKELTVGFADCVNMQEITNEDLNTLKPSKAGEVKIYWGYSAENHKHIPKELDRNSFVLHSYSIKNNFYIQFLIPWAKNKIYKRQGFAPMWGEWLDFDSGNNESGNEKEHYIIEVSADEPKNGYDSSDDTELTKSHIKVYTSNNSESKNITDELITELHTAHKENRITYIISYQIAHTLCKTTVNNASVTEGLYLSPDFGAPQNFCFILECKSLYFDSAKAMVMLISESSENEDMQINGSLTFIR